MSLGSSLKKALKKATKVATLGLSENKAFKNAATGILTGGLTTAASVLAPKMPNLAFPDVADQFKAPDPTNLENVLANVDLADAGEGELSLDPYRPRLRRQNTGLSNNVSQGGTGLRV